MPLIATHRPYGVAPDGTRRRTILSPEQRRRKMRQLARRIVSGERTADALAALGLSWARLFAWIEKDAECAQLWESCRRFRTHVWVEKAIDEAVAPVRTMPEAARGANASRAYQWAAERTAPEHYGRQLAVSQAPTVHHHVVHLPARGDRPAVLTLDEAARRVAADSGEVPADYTVAQLPAAPMVAREVPRNAGK